MILVRTSCFWFEFYAKADNIFWISLLKLGEIVIFYLIFIEINFEIFYLLCGLFSVISEDDLLKLIDTARFYKESDKDTILSHLKSLPVERLTPRLVEEKLEY